MKKTFLYIVFIVILFAVGFFIARMQKDLDNTQSLKQGWVHFKKRVTLWVTFHLLKNIAA